MSMDKAYRTIDEKLDRILELLGSKQAKGKPVHVEDTQPWPGYDDLNVAEVLDILKSKGADARAQALDYERAHKGRTTVIDGLVNWNS